MKRKYKIRLVGSSALVRIFTVKVGKSDFIIDSDKIIKICSGFKIKFPDFKHFKQRKLTAKLHMRLCVTMRDF